MDLRLVPAAALSVCLWASGACMPPSWGAAALLHPTRRPVNGPPHEPFEAVDLPGDGITLKGWWFRGKKRPRGTVVYLHGTADNRASGEGLARHFVQRGFDVVAYDSRAHGQSQGAACTYGYFEKADLRRVLDRVDAAPVILFGVSLGAAVALQTAADDPRVDGIIAVAPFSDLRTVANERAPFFASQGNIDRALALAEKEANFQVDAVSPVAAAPRIHAPTLLVHGDRDDETPPEHSRRIFAALGGEKRLILVPERGHGDSLTAEVWHAIEAWLDTVVERARAR